jgi:hypothetical protein
MQRILESHPAHPQNIVFLVDAVTELGHCALACNACADACLAGDAIGELRNCISLNLSCADLCLATARIVSRAMEVGIDLTPRLLEVCAQICGACADECEKHADHMEHCRVCAEACRRCEEECLIEAEPQYLTAGAATAS